MNFFFGILILFEIFLLFFKLDLPILKGRSNIWNDKIDD
jgi:hypothetical protein